MGEYSAVQLKRFSAFHIETADIKLLHDAAATVKTIMPQLLAGLHGAFAGWPEIQAALMKPSVHEVRVAHWTRVATGDFGAGFQESAERLAQAFYDNGVPGYAVSICHSTVVNALIAELGLRAPTKRTMFGNSVDSAKTGLRLALNKAAWFDLEVLLETYEQSERRSKQKIMNDMAAAFELQVKHVVDGLAHANDGLGTVVNTLGRTATRSLERSGQVASTAEQATANMQTVAAATEELANSVGEISKRVNDSTRIANQAVGDAQRANTKVQELAEQARKIGDVIDLISQIAAQTNLLALNATIEAARAGEAGKGFAVVASEVKNLATQTARATDEIGQQIGEIQRATGETVGSIQSIVDVISSMNGITAGIAGAVEEQDVTTRQIARNIQDAATGNKDVSAAMHGVKADANDTVAVSAKLGASATELDGHARTLQTAVQGFLQKVRAA
jgi:methyl-accepting chemotaxis protein